MTEHGYPFGHAQPPAVRRQPAGIARLTVSNAFAERFFRFCSFFIYRDNRMDAAFYLWRCQQRAWMLRGALVGISRSAVESGGSAAAPRMRESLIAARRADATRRHICTVRCNGGPRTDRDAGESHGGFIIHALTARHAQPSRSFRANAPGANNRRCG